MQYSLSPEKVGQAVRGATGGGIHVSIDAGCEWKEARRPARRRSCAGP